MSVRQQSPKQELFRIILSISLVFLTGFTIPFANRYYQLKRIENQFVEENKERVAAIGDTFANSSTRSHEELREATFDGCRLLAFKHQQGRSFHLEEHTPLESPLELSDGSWIPAENMRWFELKIAPEAPQAALTFLAVNVDIGADASIIFEIMERALDEQLEREGECETLCVVHVVARQYMCSTVRPPGQA